ncbi:MAG: DUF5666 domain-containing protein [Gammaproteobacteria bacterium]|nr:DUF5666 domain-containing protein [Gammaproteobacteria bacterium]MDH5304587.1 DUF5666 domain-containing protein [Gammaproteobacteria bacterium]
MNTISLQRQLLIAGLLAMLGACGGGAGGNGESQSAGAVQVAQASYDAMEGTVVNILVNRSGGASGTLTVQYATADDTARAGSDYAAVSGTLSWPDGWSGNRTVSIAITDDNAAEGLESFALILSNVSGGAMGANSSATIDIIDNDNVAVTAVGEITELASVTINGIRYDTNAASVLVNGQPAIADDLELGQIVALEGDVNFSTATGTADAIHYAASVIGPVENVDATLGRLIVMGQTVLADDDTVFGPDIDPGTYVGLSPGTTAQISGFRNADGDILATRIDADATSASVQLIGTVTGLDPASMSFAIGRLIVDYSSATLIDLPLGMPANGLLVMVRGALTDGILVVDEISANTYQAAARDTRGHFAGVVTRFASLTDFSLNGLDVTTSANTRYVNGASADLQANAEITIDGHTSMDGKSMLAYLVTFGRPVFDRRTTAYDFDGFTEVVVHSLSRVTVTRGAEYSVQVTAGAGALGELQVTQTGNRISLGLGNNQVFNAAITMPVLDRIEIGGNALAHVTVEGFEQPQMTMVVDGVSTLSGAGLQIGNLTATVSGVSSLNLGAIRPIGGASIAINGVSQATLNMAAGSTMSGSVRTGQGTGTSRLYYYGTGVAVNVTTDALSSIVRLGDTRL